MQDLAEAQRVDHTICHVIIMNKDKSLDLTHVGSGATYEFKVIKECHDDIRYQGLE